MLGAEKTNTRYVLPDSLDFQQLRKEIHLTYAVRRQAASGAAYTLFDTFDWRLYRKHKILTREGDRISLTSIEPSGPPLQAAWPKRRPPKFWWDFGESGLRSRLRSLIDVRALLPLMSVTRAGSRLRILNEDQKTVLSLFFMTYTGETVSGARQRALRLEIQPVLGYGREFEDFRRYLTGLGIAVDKESVPVTLMRLLGLDPGGYTSKFGLTLDPDLPSGEAVRRILGHLVEVMRVNEKGVKAGTDTEFLHDFRVAVRRIRSALGQIKGVFPPEETRRMRADFTQLGQSTNTLRDLDVYLLKREQYRSLLPDRLAPGLDALFESLAEERKKERREVSRTLNSAAYRNTIRRWEEFLDSPTVSSAEEAPNAERPVLPLARRFIFKRYRQIIRTGRKIGDGSPDEELHRLRINCKKLRYLLEFFASLFPEKDMKRLIRQLKMLQDNLGDFNDLFVQQQYLEEHLEKLIGDKDGMRQSAAAVGGLITALNRKQRDVRREFEECFRAFSSPKNSALFKRLFKAPGEGAEGP